jgi:hypothetical protein
MGEKTSSFGAKSRHRVIFDFANTLGFQGIAQGRADSKVTFCSSLAGGSRRSASYSDRLDDE